MDFRTLDVGACGLLWCEFVFFIASRWQGGTRLVGMMMFSMEGFRKIQLLRIITRVLDNRPFIVYGVTGWLHGLVDWFG